ncbi:MAG: phosphatidylglycerophosphatase A [Bdellovibrionales bacterium]|nr:phosphatidylglycerophosphatase A [Bdellovibrionales bacterium]
MIIKILATWFGCGYSKWAPGTVGTVGALPLVVGLFLLPDLVYMAVSLLLTLLAIVISILHEKQLGVHDSREIVIDEVAGFVIAMTWLPMTWQSFLGAFLVFRLLDALKPFPIGLLDKKVQGGFGVVLDDVAAGLITNVLLQIVYVKTNWLGVQIQL